MSLVATAVLTCGLADRARTPGRRSDQATTTFIDYTESLTA